VAYFASIVRDARVRRESGREPSPHLQGSGLTAQEGSMLSMGDVAGYPHSAERGLSQQNDSALEFTSVGRMGEVMSEPSSGDRRGETVADIVMPEVGGAISLPPSISPGGTDHGMLSILQDEEISRSDIADDSNNRNRVSILPKDGEAKVSSAFELLPDPEELAGLVGYAGAKPTSIESTQGHTILQIDEAAIHESVERGENAQQVLILTEDGSAEVPGISESSPVAGESAGFSEISQAEDSESMQEVPAQGSIVEGAHDFRKVGLDSAGNRHEGNDTPVAGQPVERPVALPAEQTTNMTDDAKRTVEAPFPVTGNIFDPLQQSLRMGATHEAKKQSIRSASRRQAGLQVESTRQGRTEGGPAPASKSGHVVKYSDAEGVQKSRLVGSGEEMKPVKSQESVLTQHHNAGAPVNAAQSVSNVTLHRPGIQREMVREVPRERSGDADRLSNGLRAAAASSGIPSVKTAGQASSNRPGQDAGVQSVPLRAARVERSVSPKPQPQRPPRAEKPSGPDVHIGQIDVLIQSSTNNKTRQTAEHAAPASTTCHYIKGLG